MRWGNSRAARAGLAIMLAAVVLSLAACQVPWGGAAVVGSGKVITQARAVAQVREVELAGMGEVLVSQGAAESLSVEGDDNIVPLIETVMQGDRLVIRVQRGAGNLRPTVLKYHLMVTDVRALVLSGTGRIAMPAVQTAALSVRLSGAGEIKLDAAQTAQLEVALPGTGKISVTNLTGDRVSADLAGAGELVVSGTATNEDVHLDGTGHCNLKGLVAQDGTVKLSGAGETSVHCDKTLAMQLTGAGQINYSGNAAVTQSVKGVGQIERTP